MTTATSSSLFALVSSETVDLTEAVARKFRDMQASPTERQLEEKRVKHLLDKINDGLFICPTWSTIEIDGVTNRMNGNHSSNALCLAHEAGVFPTGLQVHIDHYTTDSTEGVAQLFRQFDDRVSGRSSLDISGAYQGLYEEIRHIDRKGAWHAMKSVSWFKRQVMKESFPSKDDLGKAFEHRVYDGYLEWYSNLMTAKTPEMKPDQVGAAMYGTFEASEERARKFWHEVARGSTEDGATATDVLSDQLLAQLPKNVTKTSKMTPMQLYGICVKAWNCYVDGNAPRGKFNQSKGKPVPEIAS